MLTPKAVGRRIAIDIAFDDFEKISSLWLIQHGGCSTVASAVAAKKNFS